MKAISRAHVKSTLCIAVLSLMFFPKSASSNASCPLINGKYVMDSVQNGKPVRFITTLATRIEKGQYSYGWENREYMPADGRPRPDITDKGVQTMVTYICKDGSLIQKTQEIGANFILIKTMAVINVRQIKITFNAPGRNGIYTKQD